MRNLKKLLEYLQTELNNSRLEYRDTPTPIPGGYETTIYKFQLNNAPKEYSSPLIIRVFKENHGRPEFETIIHNKLNSLGYPIPRVYFTCNDHERIGKKFIIMEEVQGELLLKQDQKTMQSIFTNSHIRLHKIPVETIQSALKTTGLHPEEYSFKGRFDWLIRTIKDNELSSLYYGLDWVIRNKPKEPHRKVVCHTDFHPGNIMVKDGKISGVLDWSGFMIEDPALDVGFTKVLGTIAAPLIWPEIDWLRLVERYYEGYLAKNPVDIQCVRYYEAFRLLQAMVEGLMGHDAWSQPLIFSELTRSFKEKTESI